MAVATSLLNIGATAMGAAITHIGLVDGAGTELTGGLYARKAVTWTTASAGKINPTADLTFDVPAGGTAAGWRGFTALTAGTNHGGQTFSNSETFTGAGNYTLDAASTYIDLDAV